MHKSQNPKEARLTAGKKLLPTLDEFASVLNRHPGAKEAAVRLEAAGCSLNAVYRELLYYCGGTPTQIELLRKQAIHQRDWLLKLSKRLEQDAEEIERRNMKKVFQQFGLRVYVSSMDDLPQALKYYAKWLDVLHKWAKKGASLRTGRIARLVYLVFLIEHLTGKPHYEELAELIGACRNEYGSDRGTPPSAESIRKIVHHYRKKNETFLIAEAAEDEAEYLRRTSKEFPLPLSGHQTA